MTSPAEIFARLGGDIVDPPITMPASQPLELSGEAVRARLCVFVNEMGEECALRPDLTLPVALAQAEQGVSGETVKRYAARAFRLPVVPGDALEFTQVGFERYGAPSTAETDAESFALVCEEPDGYSRDQCRSGTDKDELFAAAEEGESAKDEERQGVADEVDFVGVQEWRHGNAK